MMVHLGVIIVAVAIAASGSYEHEVEARYEPGQTRIVGGHEITYVNTREVEERNRTATKVRVRVDGGQVYEPALSQYPGFGQLIGTPSVKTGLKEDVYLTITRLPDDARWSGHAARDHPADGALALDRRRRDGLRHDPGGLARTPPPTDRPRVVPGAHHRARSPVDDLDTDRDAGGGR